MTNNSKVLVDKIIEGIQDKKGHDIVIADVSHIDGMICQAFVMCTGTSPSQIEAIAESIGDKVRIDLHDKPTHVVGLGQSIWVAMDYTDVMVHVFLPEARDFYDLEHLWEDAVLEEIADLD